MKFILLAALLASLAGCKGDLASTTDGAGPGTTSSAVNNDVPINTKVTGVGTTAIRRLSREEYDRTWADLLGDTTKPGSLGLPEDTIDPFDNNYSTQRISQTLIEALENIATEVSLRAVEADNPRRDALVGCTPTAPDDTVCFDAFVTSFGRKAFRRPMTAEEVARYRPLLAYGLEDKNFYTAIGLVIQAMLQEPAFVYHVEKGVPVVGRAGVLRLNSFEVASRLSYFIWGTMPDEALLKAAENGELETPEQLRAQGERLMADDRAKERMVRFHAMWMGWYKLGEQTTLSSAMRQESEALIKRVLFDEKRDYMDLFTFDETFLTPELATHYGMTAPAEVDGGWVSYGEGGRGGILSHAAFLQVVSKFGDTSPTQRGKLIRERLMCEIIYPPPPTVNVDEPPAGGTSNCKIDRYLAIQESTGCGACHEIMDFVGFGLEGYDELGRFRTAEDEDAECLIDGQGEILGTGEFSGPKELGQMLADNGALEDCAVTQLYRFAYAHRETASDAEALAELKAKFTASGRKFDQLVLDVVSQESFLYRKVEGAE